MATIADQFKPCPECGRYSGMVSVAGGLVTPENRDAVTRAIACGVRSPDAWATPEIDIEDDVAVVVGGGASPMIKRLGFGAFVVDCLNLHGIAARDATPR